jgi:anti-sigma-K factor RskA
MNYLQPPERLDRLAREYALGTLAGGARRRFDRVIAESAVAARAVAMWQERLAVLSQSLPPMQPRAAVWQGLEERLFVAPAVASSPPARGAWGWLASVFSARTFAGALAGILLSVVVLNQQPGWIGMEPASEKLPESYVGLLVDADGKPGLLASSRRRGHLLTVKLLQPLPIPAGRVAQLWALPKDGSHAFPVGVVPGGGSATLTLSDSAEKLFFNVSRLAIVFEAAPAKPGDVPSGAFVWSGNCVKLW